jgi:hypothetical protein
MSVHDAFVDAGKAATESGDQMATIKIIREVQGRHFNVREGSVVPNLSNPRFQPQMPPPIPPVPRFSNTNQGLGKRSRDDAFREEPLGREGSHNSNSVRRRRLEVLGERETVERLVPSIERDVHHPSHEVVRQHQGSPIVIPETQDSPLRYQTSVRKGGSEILGDEPKSESPEVGNSIQSLPVAQPDINDIDMLEAASTAQNIVNSASKTLNDGEARPGAAPGQDPTSRSSSNYYSPTTGSVHSISKENSSSNESESSPTKEADVLSRPHQPSNLTRTKLNLAKEAIFEPGPITPPSDVSHNRPSKSTPQDASHKVPSAVGPQSRASSFSYKFRRDDQIQSAESEIDDTQMSPRSRKPSKPRRNARKSEAKPKAVSVKELSGLFHHLKDKQPLLLDRKRQRKETKWDFSDHVAGLSESDDDHFLPNKDLKNDDSYQSTAGSGPSEADNSEDVAAQRSKSHALSDATNLDSNASTERPIATTSVNALRLSHAAQPQVSSERIVSDAIAENDSDKENEKHELPRYTEPRFSDSNRGGNMVTHLSSTAREETRGESSDESDVGEGASNSVVGILSKGTEIQGNVSAKAKVRRPQILPSEVPEKTKSPSFPDHASAKKPRARKKKSHIEGEEQIVKPAIQQPETCGAINAMISTAKENLDHAKVSYMAKPKLGDRAVPLKPDEQLSQDLQASARASSNKLRAITKTGKDSGLKPYGWMKTGAGNANGGSTGDTPGRSMREDMDVYQESSGVENKKRGRTDSLIRQGLPNGNAAFVAASSDIPTKNVNQENTKDGKLGLGFSQSPPRKNRLFLRPNKSKDNLEHDHNHDHENSLQSLLDADQSFLKKSKSFDKMMSSQSWNVDTPTRTAQTDDKVDSQSHEVIIDIPRRKPATSDPRTNADGSSPVDVLTSSGESESDSDIQMVEESLDKPNQKSSRVVDIITRNGAKFAPADAAMPSIEITSDSESSEAETVLPSSHAVSQISKPSKNGPTIIPKGNNMYNVNGTSIVVPPGFTLDAYLAMRADLANQPAKSTLRNRITSSGKSATPTLNQKGSSATPVPVPAKVTTKKAAAKKNEKQPAKTVQGKESLQPATALSASKTVVKPISKVSKPDQPTVTPFSGAGSKNQSSEATVTSKIQPSTNATIPVKSRPAIPISSGIKPVSAPLTKPLNPKPTATKKPQFIREVMAQREMERAQKKAASSRTSGMTTPNLVNGKDIFGGDDSESGSESETETNSSDREFVASHSKPAATKSIARVDLSIRDPSPSSDEESD